MIYLGTCEQCLIETALDFHPHADRPIAEEAFSADAAVQCPVCCHWIRCEAVRFPGGMTQRGETEVAA